MNQHTSFTHLATAELTDLGLRRRRNEDATIRIPGAGVFCVADGIGGAEVGNEASLLTVNMLRDVFEATSEHPSAHDFEFRKGLVREAMNRSCRAIQDYCVERSYHSSGTTAVTIVFDRKDPARAAVLHAGDSRAYRIRDGRMEQLTSDHTLEVENAFPDNDAWAFGMRTIITRAVGVRPFVEMEETEIDVRPDDIFLLCTDGLTRMLSDAAISGLIRKQGVHDLEVTVRKLVAEANHAGGQDNITVLLVRVDDPDTMAYREELAGGSFWQSVMRTFGSWTRNPDA